RRTVTPVHECCLAAEPESALAVCKYRIDRADRYSLCLSEAFDRAFGDLTESRVRNIRGRAHHPQRPVRGLARVLERRKAVHLNVEYDRPVFDICDLSAAYCPQPTGATAKDLEYFVAGPSLVRKVSWEKLDSIESVDVRGIGREPKKAVGSLRYREHPNGRRPILYSPRRVQVLRETLIRIERPGR